MLSQLDECVLKVVIWDCSTGAFLRTTPSILSVYKESLNAPYSRLDQLDHYLECTNSATLRMNEFRAL